MLTLATVLTVPERVHHEGEPRGGLGSRHSINTLVKRHINRRRFDLWNIPLRSSCRFVGQTQIAVSGATQIGHLRPERGVFSNVMAHQRALFDGGVLMKLNGGKHFLLVWNVGG